LPFIHSSNPFWKEIIHASTPDIYSLREYVELESKILKGTPLGWIFLQQERPKVLIPLIDRVIPFNKDQYHDLVSPYGYPGIVYKENLSTELFNKVISTYHQEANGEGFISSFIRLHPLYNNIQVKKQAGITPHVHGSTVSVDLTLPMPDIRQAYSVNHRRNLAKLRRQGFHVKIDNWSDLSAFIGLYTQTMHRKHASPRYFFKEPYFAGLKNIQGFHLLLVMVYDQNNKPAAGGLFTIANGLAQFHLGGTSDGFIEFSPSKLMMDEAIAQCKERGCHTLHLGGGYGTDTNSGLFRFKAGFGSQRHPFYTLRFIHRRDIYMYLLENSIPGTRNQSSFFPEYRHLEGQG